MNAPRVGEWWTMDKRGATPAHIVAIVKPDLTDNDGHLGTSLVEWSSACWVANRVASQLLWSMTHYSTRMSTSEPPPHRCHSCEALVDRVRAVVS